VADRLSVELGYEEGAEIAGVYSPSGGEGGPMAGLNSEDELLVTTMKRGLAKIAATLAGEGSDGGAPTSAVKAALDGAEMVMRGELLRGNAAQLPALMPSFVFLVALPVVDQDRALNLSRRTAQLLDAAFDR
jgi:hypothetical protein